MNRSAKKQVLIWGGLALMALFLTGLVTGAIGNALIASFSGQEGKAEGLLPQPKVELPPVPVLPVDARQHFIEFEEVCKESPEEAVCAEGPFKGFQFTLTNTIISSWLTTLVIVAIFFFGTRRMRYVPRGLQNFCEWVVEVFLNFIEGVAGPRWARPFLPVVATIFIFVAMNAWMGLLPIYPSLGILKDGKMEVHILRPSGTDINMPLALALVSFVFVEYMGLKALGAHYITKFIRVGSLKMAVRGLFRGRFTDVLQGMIDFGFVGPLEAFSELVRIISFTLRLFGNMTAGEILVLVSAFLVSFVATVAVYGLEIFVGFVQALVFSGLTLVFAVIAVTPHAEEH